VGGVMRTVGRGVSGREGKRKVATGKREEDRGESVEEGGSGR